MRGPLDSNVLKNLSFSVISSWIRLINEHFIPNIKLNKMLYITYSTLFEKHDKLQYIVVELIDSERDLAEYSNITHF